MIHELKIEPEFYDAVVSGAKNFEIRFNDRNFQKGDFLLLRPWCTMLKKYLPNEAVKKEITYILVGWGLKPGYVCLGLK